jgi:magnesium chelatase subunit D
VSAEHVQRAAQLALLHRRRRQPFDDSGVDQKKLDKVIDNFNRERESETATEDD